ncbi:MAG: translation initiation factor IF-2 [Alphaproteobacteria bacterium]|jgi:translation initiation factor IF-2
MSDSKPDRQNKTTNSEKGKSTLSLKGVEPKTLNKTASNASGPVVELRQKRRTNANNSKRHNNQGRAGLAIQANVNSATLSKAEQDARNRALSVAKQFKEREAQEQIAADQRAIEDRANQDIQEAQVPSVSNPEVAQENPASSIDKQVIKKNAGPRVLGQVDLNRFAPSTKKTARLEGHDSSRPAKRGGKPPHNNTNANVNGKRPFNNRDKPDSRPQGTGGPRGAPNTQTNSASRTPSAQRPDFSNQRANFSSEPIAVTGKSPSRKAAPKFKAKTSFDENDANSASKKELVANKDRTRKVTIVNAADGNYEGPAKSMAAHRRRLNKRNKAAETSESAKVYREVTIPDTITVQELANRMSERSADVIKELMKLGIMATLNQILDTETAEIVVETMGHTFLRISEADVENILIDYQDAEDTLITRAPIVTIMGHVDHGKTSLLDALRKTNVVSGEAGGITQHIGAYKVRLDDGRGVTFIDTPGHAAFSEMRSRGAKVTDMVILVVAADDGVKPQTIEAIKHAKAAEVPMIIAINKIDKQGADASRVRNELLQHEIVVESLGGDVLDVEISAKENMGLDKLIEALLLQAEIMDLKSNPDRYAQGIVIEAELSKGRGPVATVLIQHGTLRVGDIVAAGASWGRVRALQNDLGQRIEVAGPADPVVVLGLGSVPLAGDPCYVMENDAKAREFAEYRETKLKAKTNITTVKTLDSLMTQIKDAQKQSLPIVIKGDVQGSVEAISVALTKLGNEEVQAQIVHSGAGGITESDINLAEASGGIVFGFNVRANKQARDLADNRKVEIRYYSIIYDLINDVKDALSGMLKPELREKFLGNAEILQVFDITKTGKVAGCRIREGMAKRSAKVRLLRDDIVIHEGTLSTLKRFKDEVKEVKEGYECGMAFENYTDMRANDVIEIFEIQEITRSL